MRLREVREDEQLVVELDASVDQSRVEEVRLEEADVDELPEAGDLRLQGERLAVAEEVRLLDLRGGDEVLDAREAGADLERAGRPLGDLEVDVDRARASSPARSRRRRARSSRAR